MEGLVGEAGPVAAMVVGYYLGPEAAEAVLGRGQGRAAVP